MAGWLESLGSIFSKDDDLENLDTDAPVKKNHLENINAWDVPFNASPSDRIIGQNDAGQLVYKTITGNTYTVSVNPDQRNPQEKLIEGAKAVGTAVLDYAEDPFIPSKEQVGEFAVNAMTDTTDKLNDMMFKGEGTIGDLVGAATFKAGAGLTASKLAPPTDAGSYMGMFLNRNAAKGEKYDSDYDKALDMEMNGIDRDTIWKETGWGKVFGEWMTETNDSITTTKGVQDAGTDLAPRYKLDAVTEENVISKAANSHKTKTAINLKYKELYRLAMKNPNEDARRTEIENLENQARVELEAASSPVNTETIKVSTNLKPTKIKPAKLSRTGNLNQVLGNADEVFDLIPKDFPMALSEAGQRMGASVPNQNFGTSSGVYYKTRDILTGKRTPNVASFKDYGPTDKQGPFVQRQDGSFGYVRDAADVDTANYVLKELDKIRLNAKNANDKLNDSEISDAEFHKRSVAIRVKRDAAMNKIYEAGKEDFIWSTMLHETQHWLDDIFKSTSGTGANSKDKDKRASIQLSAKAEYRKELNKIEDRFGSLDPDAVTPELRNQLLNEIDALNSGPKGMAADINNKGYSNLEYYYRDGGETKSRLAQSRRRLGFDERRDTPPWVTLSKMDDFRNSNAKSTFPTSEAEIWTPRRFRDYEFDYVTNPLPKSKKNFWEVDDLSASVTNQTDDILKAQ